MPISVDELARIIVQAATGKETMDKVGKEAISRIQKRTRIGKTPQGGPQKALKESTVERRARLSKAGGLTGPGARPKKSAVNRTGEMLNDLTYNAQDGKLEVGFATSRQGDKSDKLHGMGFSFMDLSKAEIKGLTDIISRAVRAAFK
jgi:hypothetical protein